MNNQQSSLRRNKAWALIDSDLEDENYDSEMDELFSLGNNSLEDHCEHVSHRDSDDDDDITANCDLKTRDQKMDFYEKCKAISDQIYLADKTRTSH